jgi:hypothetical protein
MTLNIGIRAPHHTTTGKSFRDSTSIADLTAYMDYGLQKKRWDDVENYARIPIPDSDI